MKLLTHINNVMFNADLLNTSCVSNGSESEYNSMSNALYDYMMHNNYVATESMVESLLSDALALYEDDLLSDFVPQQNIKDVVKELNIF